MLERAQSLSDRINEAEAEYRLVSALENERQRAEITYVLAKLYREAGDQEQARQYASRSIALFQKLDITTLEAAQTRYNVFAGVVVPALIHENVVRQTFSEYNL